ncbi:class I SAM-dependent methyltransferase [Paludibacterium yongneupense]|uniref:class I SAM-dependent methyltransferase n=1 Tax=Paludibacterium yongneupense TaxID=400061 RepID=UPI000425A244|nr:class I SAM-dependent methyltransferase [Paludibacterium yongneupense]
MLDVSALANRLTKNWKHYGKWARRQGVAAWRVYDRDIPQFPLAIDIYGEHCHIQEYETGWVQDDAEHDLWLDAVKNCIRDVTGIPAAQMGVKTRRRQKGESQYQKLEKQSDDFVVEEFGLRFWVNMDAYLDTGLFLDHRNTRRQVMGEAAGKRFLNLFAYTGSFTVYAAAGGAIRSETVDLSNTYQQWTRRNFDLNGIDSRVHTLVRDDVFHYLTDALALGKQFDLIVMDPPTFSNSKRMDDILDVQRDHVWLIEQAMALLAENGVLYFSSNLRSFQLDERLPVLYSVEDISRQSVPDDFRNKKIHRCFRLQNHS